MKDKKKEERKSGHFDSETQYSQNELIKPWNIKIPSSYTFIDISAYDEAGVLILSPVCFICPCEPASDDDELDK